jgi:hypothetical protein
MAIRTILWTFGIFYDQSVHFVFIWYIFSGFGAMHQDKSGNPGVMGGCRGGNCSVSHSRWL